MRIHSLDPGMTFKNDRISVESGSIIDIIKGTVAAALISELQCCFIDIDQNLLRFDIQVAAAGHSNTHAPVYRSRSGIAFNLDRKTSAVKSHTAIVQTDTMAVRRHMLLRHQDRQIDLITAITFKIKLTSIIGI